MSLTNFHILGRSSLVVNSLALGTMTFGTQHWAQMKPDRGSFDYCRYGVDRGVSLEFDRSVGV